MKKFEQVSNQICGSYTFNSFFDSGNLGKVELVKITADCEYSGYKLKSYGIHIFEEMIIAFYDAIESTFIFFTYLYIIGLKVLKRQLQSKPITSTRKTGENRIISLIIPENSAQFVIC
jgi:hypothetical protein